MKMISNKRLTEHFLNLLETILQENVNTFNENKIVSQLEYFIQEHLDSGCTLKRITNVIYEETESAQQYLYENNQLNQNRELVLEFIKNAIKGIIKAPVKAAGYVKGLKDRATTAFGRAYGQGYASGRGSSYTGHDTSPTGFSPGRQAGEQEVIDRRQQANQPARASDRVTVNDTQPNYQTPQTTQAPQNLYRQQSQTQQRNPRQVIRLNRQRQQTARQFMRTARTAQQNRNNRPTGRTTNVGGSRPAPPVMSAIDPR
jgi:hypothetical protein